eukprot:3933584-Rhodomonas_salina.2
MWNEACFPSLYRAFAKACWSGSESASNSHPPSLAICMAAAVSVARASSAAALSASVRFVPIGTFALSSAFKRACTAGGAAIQRMRSTICSAVGAIPGGAIGRIWSAHSPSIWRWNDSSESIGSSLPPSVLQVTASYRACMLIGPPFSGGRGSSGMPVASPVAGEGKSEARAQIPLFPLFWNFPPQGAPSFPQRLGRLPSGHPLWPPVWRPMRLQPLVLPPFFAPRAVAVSGLLLPLLRLHPAAVAWAGWHRGCPPVPLCVSPSVAPPRPLLLPPLLRWVPCSSAALPSRPCASEPPSSPRPPSWSFYLPGSALASISI